MSTSYRSESKPVSLLLVEDDEIDATAVRRALAVLKIANPLHIARDGIEALEALRGENGRDKITRPYMILLDLNMPRMDGREFLEELRKDPELADSIVFIMTTSRNEEDKRVAYSLNVAGYIVKEDPIGTFRQAINLLDHYWRLVELP